MVIVYSRIPIGNGQIVEDNTSFEIFNNPKDNYTIKLIESVPKLKYKLNL